MTLLIGLIIIAFLAIIAVQIGKVSDLAREIRGKEEVEIQSNNRTAVALVVFMVVFLALCVGTAIYYKDQLLGHGPLTSASVHGYLVDSMFNATLFVTSIVFFVTQILLFWYSYKYRQQKGRKAKFISHNNTIELIWTVVPTIVLVFLVTKGLIAWNSIMPDLGPDDEFLEIEATGYQFAWDLRHPGNDGVLGNKDYRLINMSTNPLGIDWNDAASIDDIVYSGSDKIVLPVDTTVRVRITSKDVLHNFYLPHFRVKMDAVPGMPTYFIFTPNITTAQYRQQLSEYPEWNEPYDPSDPESKPRWKEFNFELACAELCGKGHYSMRRVFEIVTQDEYRDWLKEQKSYYLNNIRNTDDDPRKGQLLDIEISKRAAELTSDFNSTINSDDLSDIISLRHVFYKTGSAELSNLSHYELDNLARIMNKFPTSKIELRGHTDNIGDDELNMSLSQSRADNVKAYLVSKGIDSNRLITRGYGETLPVESNDTAEGRSENRRTELKIISK